MTGAPDTVADLSRYLPGVLLDPAALPPYWEREGTLLFADVSGFTQLSERLARGGRSGAEVLVAAIGHIFSPLLAVCDELRGDVLKFGGDALLIFFDGPGHLERGCLAADRIRRTLRRVGTVPTDSGTVSLRISQGLHTDVFNFFLVGEEHVELLVVGGAATRTTEMEAAADAQEVLVSPDAAALLDRACLGPVKGPGVLLRAAPDLLTPLMPSRPSTSREASLERFVPIALRGRLGAVVRESEHRQATIGFLMFQGLDELLLSRGAAEVHRRLDALTRAVVAATTEYRIAVLCTDVSADGGKFLLASGIPDAQEDADVRMLRAARNVLAQDLGLSLRVGVHRGHVYCGAVGGPERFTYSTMGDAVNLAARVMGKASPGSILATRDVASRCAGRFDFEEVEPFTVKGKTQLVEAVVVGRGLRVSHRSEAEGTLVGREPQVAMLVAAANSALAGHGQVVEVVAEIGAGKSRLVAQALRGLRMRRTIELACEPYDASTPYLVAGNLLLAALEVSPDTPPARVKAAVARVLETAAPDLAPAVALLDDLFGPVLEAGRLWERDSAAVRALSPRLRQQRLLELVRRLLRATLPPGTLIVIDDSMWADDASAELLTPLLHDSDYQGWCVWLARRPGSAGLHSGLAFGVQPVELPPLNECEALAVLTDIDPDMLPHVAGRLAGQGAGNPLYLVQLALASASGSDPEQLPADIESLVASQIDTLAAADRRLLRYAAVLGVRFSEQDLDLALGDALSDVVLEGRWERLAGFVRRDPDGSLRFESEMFQRVAYEALPFVHRRRVHAAAGELFERMGAVEGLELLSLHFHHAQQHEKSWLYSRRAGDKALALFANLEAIQLYRRAELAWRHLAQPVATELADVAEGLGDALEVTGQFEAASAAYARARRREGSDPSRRLRLLLKEGTVRERWGKYPAAVRWYGRAFRELTEPLPIWAGDVPNRLMVSMAGVRFRQGKLQECVDWALRAVAAPGSGDHRASLANAYHLLDSALTDLGRSDCENYRGRALPIYDELGDLIGQGNVLNNLGVNAYYEGDWDRALSFYAQSRERRDRAGDVVGSAACANNLAEILSDQGHLDEASELFRRALRAFRSIGYAVGSALCESNLGRVSARAGRFSDAHQLLGDALTTFQQLGAQAFYVETQARIAEALFAQSEYYRARTLCDVALEAAVGVDAAVARTMLTRIRGLSLLLQGHVEDGHANILTSVATARSTGVEFELGVSLTALALAERELGLETADTHAAEGAAILTRLHVVHLGCYTVCAEPNQVTVAVGI